MLYVQVERCKAMNLIALKAIFTSFYRGRYIHHNINDIINLTRETFIHITETFLIKFFQFFLLFVHNDFNRYNIPDCVIILEEERPSAALRILGITGIFFSSTSLCFMLSKYLYISNTQYPHISIIIINNVLQ